MTFVVPSPPREGEHVLGCAGESEQQIVGAGGEWNRIQESERVVAEKLLGAQSEGVDTHL